MRCDECGSRETSFDERLGERVCDDCGLVIVIEQFEETVRGYTVGDFGNARTGDKGHLGSFTDKRISTVRTGAGHHMTRGVSDTERAIMKGIQLTNMVFGSLGFPSVLKERTEQIYRECFRKRVFGQYGMEVRATAIAYYVMKENRTPVPLSLVCQEYDVSRKAVNRLIRRITKHYGNKTVNQNTTDFEVKRLAQLVCEDPTFSSLCCETLVHFEKVLEALTISKSKSFVASIVYMTSIMYDYKITGKAIEDFAFVSRASMIQEVKRLIKPFGFKLPREIKGKTLNDFEMI